MNPLHIPLFGRDVGRGLPAPGFPVGLGIPRRGGVAPPRRATRRAGRPGPYDLCPQTEGA